MRKLLAMMLALMLLINVTWACADSQPQELAHLTYFPQNSMPVPGNLSGGVAKLFAGIGVEIEMLPHSATKLQSMLASGDLCDVLWLPEQELQYAMEAGYLLDMSPYLDDMPNLQEHIDLFAPSLEFAREYCSAGTGNVYYLAPVGDPLVVVSADTDRHAIKVNWELYAKSGYPEFSTLEESIEVFKKMQQDTPYTADGTPTYAMHLFPDYDTDYFYNMYSIYAVLGKACDYLPYGIEWDYRTGEGVSIFSEGSTYHRGLKFFYEMNQAGLIDPDSLVQTRAMAKEKIDAGTALAGWAANPGWEALGGYYPVLFDEFVPSYQTSSPYGKAGYCISADCKNPEAAIRFLDLLASDDAVMMLRNGPPGCVWDVDEEGQAYLIDPEDLLANSLEEIVDEEGDSWAYSIFPIYYLLNQGYVTKYGVPYLWMNMPDMYDTLYSSDLARDWTAHYGYPYLNKLLAGENWEQAIESEGYSAFLTADTDRMQQIKAGLRAVIIYGSWEMVYAASEEEFNSIWADMKQRCEDIGIDEVIAYKLEDIANAKRLYQEIAE